MGNAYSVILPLFSFYYSLVGEAFEMIVALDGAIPRRLFGTHAKVPRVQYRAYEDGSAQGVLH